MLPNCCDNGNDFHTVPSCQESSWSMSMVCASVYERGRGQLAWTTQGLPHIRFFSSSPPLPSPTPGAPGKNHQWNAKGLPMRRGQIQTEVPESEKQGKEEASQVVSKGASNTRAQSKPRSLCQMHTPHSVCVCFSASAQSGKIWVRGHESLL